MDKKPAPSCQVHEPGNRRRSGCAVPFFQLCRVWRGSKTCVLTPRFGHWGHGGTGACAKVDAAPAPWQTCLLLRPQAKPADATPIHSRTPATAFFSCTIQPSNSNKRAIVKYAQNAIAKANATCPIIAKCCRRLVLEFFPCLREDHN